MASDFKPRVGEKVQFIHVEGPIPAEVIQISEDGQKVQLKIANWLGTHWFPINEIKPD